ncbi:MAG: hypothetical protein LBT14_14405 [Treponema sp.]|jgi:hypothetical protein|nr:hypothetical protein [Treponema sp.]
MSHLHVLTPLQKQIINYIIAENEETESPNTLADYMSAIEGGFNPHKKFTLYLPAANKLVLYEYNKKGTTDWCPRSEFYAECETIKKTLVKIAESIIYLCQDDYVRVFFRNPKEKTWLPQDYQEHWRAYEMFMKGEVEPLLYVCSIRIVPKLKLYKFWETLHR